MSPRRHSEPRRPSRGRSPRQSPAVLRVIGGRLRGRTFQYDGDPATRPMKDRVREAVFNLLGPSVRGRLVLDLFAGTGAMAWESLSRGAARAVLIERRFPTARIIRENAAQLGLSAQITVVCGDAFIWAKQPTDRGAPPWLVFICPPYDFFVTRSDDMVKLLVDLLQASPAGSLFVVECDARFDLGVLPDAGAWDIRPYPPAVIAILERNHGHSEP